MLQTFKKAENCCALFFYEEITAVSFFKENDPEKDKLSKTSQFLEISCNF